MNKIAEEVERDSYYRSIINANASSRGDECGRDPIARAARYFAETLI